MRENKLVSALGKSRWANRLGIIIACLSLAADGQENLPSSINSGGNLRWILG